MIITSDRKFGVEVEFYAPSEKSLRAVASRINTTRDGSLDGKDFGREYVSPVLQGKQGEAKLRTDCLVLKQYGCVSGDMKTSMHIHIDGKRNEVKATKAKSLEPSSNQVALSNKLINNISEKSLEKLLTGSMLLPHDIFMSRIDNVTYYGYSVRTKHPKINYQYFNLEEHDDFNLARNALYFYTQYSDVMEMMVSNSRKSGNMYCIPLGDCYELSSIEDCKTLADVESVWYKTPRRSGGHYDDSRYHNVNLHSLLGDSKGTIEIRSHGGTTDPDKILLWVRLHQNIIDKLDTMTLEQIKAKNSNLLISFIDFISDDPLLVEYVKRLVGYFSNVRI